MLKVDAGPLLYFLEKAAELIERKLKNMVREVALDVVQAGTENTPLGDSRTFISLYLERQKDTRLEPIEGVAQGAWIVSFGELFFVPHYGTDSYNDAIGEATMDMQQYKLGQPFRIANTAPYIANLEGNSSIQTNGMGIVEPTTRQAEAVINANLKTYYDRGK